MPKRQVRTVAKGLKLDDPNELLAVLVAAGLAKEGAKDTAQVDEAQAQAAWEASIAVGPSGDSSVQPTVEVTANDLVEEFRSTSLKDFTTAYLAEVAPDLPRIKRKGEMVVPKTTAIPPERLASLRELLVWLSACQQVVDEDIENLNSWTAPSAEDLLRMLYSGLDQISYTGICGHEVEQSIANYTERYDSMMEGNSRLSVLLRLCSKCRADRVSLLQLGPGAANFESICDFCDGPTFAGRDPAASFAQSRGDIWENFISQIFPVYFLPTRLGPRHPMRHYRHVAIMAKARGDFESWEKLFRAEIASIVSAHPEMGAELKAGMNKTIHDKRVDLGLEEA
ncbi:MAG TPA: hypothetical protein VLE72_00540 [Candidatus Saccharimonadales bacterium]|nr:hypothetical protein [Candidatus Saccharimonadales bacterium]